MTQAELIMKLLSISDMVEGDRFTQMNLDELISEIKLKGLIDDGAE